MRCPRIELALALASAAASAEASTASFDWASISPSTNLVYQDCFAGFKCSLLTLPLDWRDEADNRTIDIAIIKYPAVVADADPTFGGPILLNPGGPGSSGVAFLRKKATYLQRFLDRPGRRHYELIAFDPRGVSNSRPRADCFGDSLINRWASVVETRGIGALDGDGSKIAVPHMLAMQGAISDRCERTDDHRLLAYMNTPSVARDMVEIIDKIEELRTKEMSSREHHPSSEAFELKKRRLHSGMPRLQYIGFSYGGTLGNYFASMFPGRVGRMILDGTGDAIDYATGAGYLTNLVDSDKMVEELFRGCHEAGPAVCAMSRKGDNAFTDIVLRFNKWISRLEDFPESTVSQTGSIIILTSQDVRRLIFDALYKPLERFKQLMITLDQAMRGNMTDLVTEVEATMPSLRETCNNTVANIARPEAETAFVCADGDSISANSVDWWRRYIRNQTETSKWFGAYWSTIRMGCFGWKVSPSWVFKGPFTTPEAITSASGDPIAGHPAAPILFLCNRLDPVSPLSAARRMAAGHPGAGLLIQETLGHCVIGQGTSNCTRSIISDYLEFGTVPKGEVMCKTDCGPWDLDC